MDEDARRERRAQRDINWALIAGRGAIERDGLPPDDTVFLRSMRRALLFGLFCGLGIAAALSVVVVCIIEIVR